MPETHAVLRELGSERHYLELEELAILKQKYGLSMSAWIRRAYDLGIIPEIQYRQWCKLFSIRRWRSREPVDYKNPFEKLVRRRQLMLRALGEGRITPKQAERLCPEALETSKLAPPGRTSLRSLLMEAQAYEARMLEEQAEYTDRDPFEELEILEGDDCLGDHQL